VLSMGKIANVDEIN